MNLVQHLIEVELKTWGGFFVCLFFSFFTFVKAWPKLVSSVWLMSHNINLPTWNEWKSLKRQLKHFHQQQDLFWSFLFLVSKSAQDCRRCLPACLIYSACGRIKIRVSGLCCCLATILQTSVIFHMCKAVWWAVWQPVWPKTGRPYRKSPPHGWLMR